MTAAQPPASSGSVLSPDTMKTIAESLGIRNIKDSVAAALALDTEFRLREILQQALTFTRHAKRTRMTPGDINAALALNRVQPVYGYENTMSTAVAGDSTGFRGFKKALLSSQEVFFQDDPELDLDAMVHAPMPLIPRPVTFTAHWLAVEGVQPAVPQNPTPEEANTVLMRRKTAQRPAVGVGVAAGGVVSLATPMAQPVTNVSSPAPLSVTAAVASVTGVVVPAQATTAGGLASDTLTPGVGTVAVKPVVKHQLSRELQVYHDRVTSALASGEPELVQAALRSLAVDSGLHQLIPYLVQFVAEFVATKIGTTHLPMSLVGMLGAIKSLLDNPHVVIEPYLHQMIPPVLTVLLARRLTSVAPNDNHWTLRDTASTVLGRLVNSYAGSYHTLRPRLVRTLVHAWLDVASRTLPTQYGALVGLAALGPAAITTVVMPNLATYYRVLESVAQRARQPIMTDGEQPSQEERRLQLHESERVHSAVVTALRVFIKDIEDTGTLIEGQQQPIKFEELERKAGTTLAILIRDDIKADPKLWHTITSVM